jgi:glucose-6-phosphate 1-dehydrogenase
MECPVDLSAESVRDEKVKVLKCIKPVPMDKIILGQYAKSADGSKPGYLDDKTVPAGSNCPTFAAMILHVNNERWSGVPFILKAGKALDEKKVEIRIQFEDHPGTIFPDSVRNELVIRLQPDEAVYLKMMVKKPGLGMETTISELDLSYKSRYNDAKIPDAYEALILDVLNGDRSNFVRSDELEAAWKIFTPALHHIEREKVKPIPYLYGSRYPAGTAEFIRQHGYVRSDREYIWSPSAQKL